MSKSISFDPFSHGIQKTGFTGEYTRKMEELDKLAFFFSIKQPCAAAGFSGDMKKVYIAYNSSLEASKPEDLKFQFLKKILQAKETPSIELITSAMLVTNFHFSDSIKKLPKLLQKDPKESDIAKTMIDHIKYLEPTKSSKIEPYYESVTQRAQTLYQSYNELLSLTGIDKLFSVLNILNIRDIAKFIFYFHQELSRGDYQFIENPYNLHAELALYHYTKSEEAKTKYIGVSIKSCLACFSVLTSAGVQLRGSHTIVDLGGVNSLLQYWEIASKKNKEEYPYKMFAAILISDGKADGDEYFQDPQAYNPHATKSLTDDDYRSRYHDFSDSKEEVCYEDSSEYQFSYDDSSEEEVSDDENSSEIARKLLSYYTGPSAASLAAGCSAHHHPEESADISTIGDSDSADE